MLNEIKNCMSPKPLPFLSHSCTKLPHFLTSKLKFKNTSYKTCCLFNKRVNTSVKTAKIQVGTMSMIENQNSTAFPTTFYDLRSYDPDKPMAIPQHLSL